MAAGDDEKSAPPPDPRVDVVIPVHSATRPVARAASSALRNTVAVRVTVVAHNIDPATIAANLGALIDDPRVRLLEHRDGIASPAGPMNVGFALATGDYLALLGSDDEFEAGALDAWTALAERDGADVVIAPIQDLGRPADPYPPVRPGRTGRLDPDRDRLSYRSAPLGLISRARFGDVRFAEGIGSGEDLPVVTRLWFSGARISFDPSGPAYLGHVDEPDRVTGAPRPIAEDFRFLDVIEDDPLFATMSRPQRLTLTLKIVRIHIFDAIVARLGESGLSADVREALATVLQRLRRWAPGFESYLARTDRRAIATALRPGASRDEIARQLAARWAYGRPGTLITANPVLSLHRHAPFRTLFAGTLVRRAIAAGIARRGSL